MTTLTAFPMKDQRTEKTSDGRPPENGNYDCVPTSFAAAVQYLTGRAVNGDELKDAEYGESYRGGTALRRYVDDMGDRARSVYGVSATPFNSSDTAKLVAQIHTWVKQGFPVIGTIPSAWGTAHDGATLAKPSFSTHVVCFYSEGDGKLTAMNPWGGFAHSGDDDYWRGRLCYAQVWKIYKEATMAGIPTGWKDSAKGEASNFDGVLTAPNGVAVVKGFRKWVLEHSWSKDNYPLAAEQHLASIEYGNPSIGGGARQDFRWSSLGWTSERDVYTIWTGQDIVALKKQLADALAMVADLKQHATDPNAVVLTAQQKEDLANMATLRSTLESMLDGKAS